MHTSKDSMSISLAFLWGTSIIEKTERETRRRAERKKKAGRGTKPRPKDQRSTDPDDSGDPRESKAKGGKKREAGT
jgi:hypothetical protein